MRFRRAIACLCLVAGYLLPFRYPAIREQLIGQNDLWPEVAVISGPTTAA